MSLPGGEPPAAWRIRLSQRARKDIDGTHKRMAAALGQDTADRWQDDLIAAIGTLATFPERCAVIPERDEFEIPVRHYLFRRQRKDAVYRVLFELQQLPDDPPTVYILHVRHGSQQPIDPEEAIQIVSDSFS